jgi:DNA-directed RNA polymerase specialized sigma24 family protein
VEVAADTGVPSAVAGGRTLADVWPEVSCRLTKLLMSRGAPRDVADDVVQEVAARVLAKEIVFGDATDLLRWAVPVALNLLVDNARSAHRVTPVTETPDQPVADVADLVAHRDRLGRVLGAIRHLSPADQAALTASDDLPADRREAVRLAVRRHRARRRLLALVDGVAAFAAFLAGWAKRSRVPVTAVAVAPVAFVLGVTVSPSVPMDTAPRTAAVQGAPSVRTTRVAQRAVATAAGTARPATVTRKVAARPAQQQQQAERKTTVSLPTGGGVYEEPKAPNDRLVCVEELDRLPVAPPTGENRVCAGPETGPGS